MLRSTLAWTAVALLAVSACSAGSSSSSQPAQSSAGPEHVGQVDLLNYYVPATGVEFREGTKFSSERSRLFSGLTNECMEESGFSFPVRTGDFLLFNNVEFPDLERINREKQLVPGGPGDEVAAEDSQGGIDIPEGQQDAYMARVQKCQETSLKSFAQVDKIGNALREDWLDEVRRIQASDQVLENRSKFSACATEAGVSADSATTFEKFMAWVTGQMTKVTSPDKLPAEDRHWAEVFSKCSGDTVELQESLQVKAKEKFVQDRFSQIQELEKVANTEVSEAQAQLTAG